MKSKIKLLYFYYILFISYFTLVCNCKQDTFYGREDRFMLEIQYKDVFSDIEGEMIASYEAYIIDHEGQKWRYAHNRRPSQSIEGFEKDIRSAFEAYGYDDFRIVEEE